MIQHFYKKIPGWFKKYHVKEFSKIISELPDNATWVEVGSWKGKSLIFTIVESLKIGKTFKIYAIDTWEGSKEHQKGAKSEDQAVVSGTLYEEFLSNTSQVKDFFTPLRSTSVGASKQFDDCSIDAIYIDAAHDYESVTQDCKAWLPKMKPQGIMIFDDCVRELGVWQAVQDCAKESNSSIYHNKRVAVIRLGQ